MDDRDTLSQECLRIAEELEKAASHCRVASSRFSKKEIPAGCAHLFATFGHMAAANKSINQCAETHRMYAQLPSLDISARQCD